MMTFSHLTESRGPFKGLGFIIVVFLIFPITLLTAKGKWSLSTSLSYSTGKYIYESEVQNYALYLGARYSVEDFSISVTIPFVIQRDNLDSSVITNSHNSSHMDDNHAFSTGMSDIYLYSEYKFYNFFFMTGQIKISMSGSSTLFSTGEFDYSLGLAFRKMYGTYKIFTDTGYLFFGDPDQFTYNGPFVHGIGIAKHSENGRSSASFYYQEYGQIITGLDRAHQLSVAYFRLLSHTLGISFYGSKGFGETTADYTFSLGIEYNSLIKNKKQSIGTLYAILT